MSNDISKRERKINVDNLTPEQANEIGLELGKKIGQIGDEVTERVNKLTQIYGIQARVAIQLIDIKTGNVL